MPVSPSLPAAEGAQAQQFPCRACGAELCFRPGSGNLRCLYCGHEERVKSSTAEIVEHDYHAALARQRQADASQEMLLAHCDGCGADLQIGEGLTAFDCPYCGSPVVAQAQSASRIMPQALLPFAISRELARRRYQDWLRRRWFAPSDLAKWARQHEDLCGMYVPFWTYDTDTVSFYTGQRGDDYTETYRDGDQTKTRTRTSWSRVSGTVYQKFDDVLVVASNSLPRQLTQRLEPWDLAELQPHASDFLAGFRCEAYHIDLEEGFEAARQEIDIVIHRAVKRDIGGDHQRVHRIDSEYRNLTYKHLLLPIWITAYRYRNKVYRLLVNARTGEVQGDRPWSVVKIVLASLAALLLVGAAVWFFQHA